MTLPADKYLIEALAVFGYSAAPADVKRMPMGYSDIIAHARALERIAELEAQLTPDFNHEPPVYSGEMAARFLRERDEALAKLAKYEPPVDPDLVLARDVAAKWLEGGGCLAEAAAVRRGKRDNVSIVQGALTGIKAGRELGGGL